jgi:hypothetical protein
MYELKDTYNEAVEDNWPRPQGVDHMVGQGIKNGHLELTPTTGKIEFWFCPDDPRPSDFLKEREEENEEKR